MAKVVETEAVPENEVDMASRPPAMDSSNLAMVIPNQATATRHQGMVTLLQVMVTLQQAMATVEDPASRLDGSRLLTQQAVVHTFAIARLAKLLGVLPVHLLPVVAQALACLRVGKKQKIPKVAARIIIIAPQTLLSGTGNECL